MELTLPIIVSILTLHWFCDFILQTRKQAENKSKSLLFLSVHVSNYFGGFVIVLLPFSYITGRFSDQAIMTYCIANALAHWVTDFFTSRWTSYLWHKKDIHSFFAVIGFDQLIHTTTLLTTAAYFNERM